MTPPREAAACAVCGAADSEAAALFLARDPDGLEERPFRVVECRRCGHAFVSPRPPAEDLGRFYPAGYYDKPGEDSGAAGRRLARLFMAERLAKAAGGRAPGRVLDAGCGEGTFLAAMARRGWEAWGVELSAAGAARAAARPGLRVLQGTLESAGLPERSFDLITLWHSIEHMPEPARALRRAARLLKEDGELFLAFPNRRSWDFSLFGARWFHLDPPRHLQYFSPQAMSRLLEECGLRAARVSHLSFEYNPFGFVQSALNVLTPRMNFLYRRLKGTFRPEERRGGLDAALTAGLVLPLAALSVPYTLAAALAGASGCVDVRARLAR